MSFNPNPILPDPSEYGWIRDDASILWRVLSEASRVFRELVECGRNMVKRNLQMFEGWTFMQYYM